MVDVKISELPVAGSAAGTDQLEANQAGTSRSITVAQIGTSLGVAAGAPYLPLAGGTLSGPGTLTGTAATFSGNITQSGSSASGGHLLFADSNTGGQTWQVGPGAGTGSTDEWSIYNQGTAIKIVGFQKTGTTVLAGGLSGTVATFSGALTSKDHTVVGPGGVNSGIVSHDDTNMRVRAQNSGSLVLLGGTATDVLAVSNTAAFPVITKTYGLGRSTAVWNAFHTVNSTYYGATSGTTTVQAPAVAGAVTITLPSTTGTLALTTEPGAQIQMVSTETGAVQNTTAVIPLDDTIPQITEGLEVMTLAITPKSATSKLHIQVTAILCHSIAGSTETAALFQDATVNALAAAFQTNSTIGGPCTITFTHVMTSGTTSATTFRVRMGSGTAGTLTFNGSGGTRFYGGTLASSIVIREIA